MPIFECNQDKLSVIPLMGFAAEKQLQKLIEANLDVTFGCKFIASEFSTGSVHGGRIDTLALSEDGSPVIIEYKKVETSGLINQALYYLDWLKDHKGDFEVKVADSLGPVTVDWSSIRVICIAPSYDNYALHAVKHMPAEIELWKYRNFANGTFELEEVFSSQSKRKLKTEISKPDSIVRADEVPEYTIEQHRDKGTPNVQEMFDAVHEHILSLDDAISVVPRKLYVAYKLAKNIACVEVQQGKLVVTLNRKSFVGMPNFFFDVTNKGHWGTGDIEIQFSKQEQLAQVLEGITETYRLAGGN